MRRTFGLILRLWRETLRLCVRNLQPFNPSTGYARKVRLQALLCAVSVFSVPPWLMNAKENNHRDTENTEVAQRNSRRMRLFVQSPFKPSTNSYGVFPVSTLASSNACCSSCAISNTNGSWSCALPSRCIINSVSPWFNFRLAVASITCNRVFAFAR